MTHQRRLRWKPRATHAHTHTHIHTHTNETRERMGTEREGESFFSSNTSVSHSPSLLNYENHFIPIHTCPHQTLPSDRFHGFLHDWRSLGTFNSQTEQDPIDILYQVQTTYTDIGPRWDKFIRDILATRNKARWRSLTIKNTSSSSLFLTLYKEPHGEHIEHKKSNWNSNFGWDSNPATAKKFVKRTI